MNAQKARKALIREGFWPVAKVKDCEIFMGNARVAQVIWKGRKPGDVEAIAVRVPGFVEVEKLSAAAIRRALR